MRSPPFQPIEEERAAHAQRMQKPFSTGETVCGPGSTMANTKNVRRELPRIVAEYGVKTLNNAGCGDQHWIDVPALGCDYSAFDLHFGTRLDITAETMPPCDLILCRDVLIHMRQYLILAALERFAQSAPLLLATSYDGFSHDHLMQYQHAYRIHLGEEPFSLPLIERIEESHPGKFLGLWNLGSGSV